MKSFLKGQIACLLLQLVCFLYDYLKEIVGRYSDRTYNIIPGRVLEYAFAVLFGFCVAWAVLHIQSRKQAFSSFIISILVYVILWRFGRNIFSNYHLIVTTIFLGCVFLKKRYVGRIK